MLSVVKVQKLSLSVHNQHCLALLRKEGKMPHINVGRLLQYDIVTWRFCFWWLFYFFITTTTLTSVDFDRKFFLGKHQSDGQLTGEIYKGKTTWETPFLQSSTQRTKWLNCSLFSFPPWGQYVGTNVPVTRTMDHTEVRCQTEDFQHQQHNYLPHTHAHTPDMRRPVRQSEAMQSRFMVNGCLGEKKKRIHYIDGEVGFLV